MYDNSQLARVYLHAWILTSARSQAVTGNEFFRTITKEIMDYVIHEMTDPAGGFYSTQDADSEGEEGKFFVRTPGEIREVLRDYAEGFMAAYGVSPGGNASTGSAHGFEGENILELVGDMQQHTALPGHATSCSRSASSECTPGATRRSSPREISGSTVRDSRLTLKIELARVCLNCGLMVQLNCSNNIAVKLLGKERWRI